MYQINLKLPYLKDGKPVSIIICDNYSGTDVVVTYLQGDFRGIVPLDNVLSITKA